MQKVTTERRVTQAGQINVPTSFIGKWVNIEYVNNGVIVKNKVKVSPRGTGGYVNFGRKLAGTIVTIDISNLFSLKELQAKERRKEYLRRFELLLLRQAEKGGGRARN